MGALGGALDELPDYQPTVQAIRLDTVTDDAVRAGAAALARSMARGGGMSVHRVAADGSEAK